MNYWLEELTPGWYHETLTNPSQIAEQVGTTIHNAGQHKKNKSPPRNWFYLLSERPYHQSKQPQACIKWNHTVRPGNLPAHCSFPKNWRKTKGLLVFCHAF